MRHTTCRESHTLPESRAEIEYLRERMAHLPGKADHVLIASCRGDREFADTFQSIQLADRWARSLRFASQLNRRNPLIQ
jgi:hypothetical protein